MNHNNIFREIDQTIKNKESNNMATHKRITITIHPIELKRLDEIAKENNETRSGMIQRLIQSYR